MTGVIEWVGAIVLFGVMIFWFSGGIEGTFAFFARRQEIKHKERMAQIEASKKNKGSQ